MKNNFFINNIYMKFSELSKFSTKELKYILKQKKIKNYSKLNKAELLEKMQEIYKQKGGAPKNQTNATSSTSDTGDTNTDLSAIFSSKIKKSNTPVGSVAPKAANVHASGPAFAPKAANVHASGPASAPKAANVHSSGPASAAKAVTNPAFGSSSAASRNPISFNEELSAKLKLRGKTRNITQNQESSYVQPKNK